MPFLKSLPDDAGPPNIFVKYPEIYGPWSHMSQALMNGPSPLSQGERELLLTYAAGVAGCDFVKVAHAEVTYAWGIERGLVDQLLAEFDTAPISAQLRALLVYVRKLMLNPTHMQQQDVDLVLASGCGEDALHDAISIAARAAFMQRLVSGYGFQPLSQEVAASHAKKRVQRGYVNLYSKFREDQPK
jgi:uncharacterized peroxidase-related enzyme